MVTNKNASTFLLVVVNVGSLAFFGMVATTLGATTPIPSLYEPTSASRLQALPYEWSIKVWEGIGQVQVVQENHQKVLRLETEHGCISLFRSLTVNLQANPVVSWEWSVLTLPTGGVSSESTRDDLRGRLVPGIFIQGDAKKENYSWIYLGQCSSGRDNSCTPQ